MSKDELTEDKLEEIFQLNEKRAEEISKNITNILVNKTNKERDLILEEVDSFVDYYLDLILNDINKIYEFFENIELPLPDNCLSYKNKYLTYTPKVKYPLEINEEKNEIIWKNKFLFDIAKDKLARDCEDLTKVLTIDMDYNEKTINIMWSSKPIVVIIE